MGRGRREGLGREKKGRAGKERECSQGSKLPQFSPSQWPVNQIVTVITLFLILK